MQLVRFAWDAPFDVHSEFDTIWVDLCLTPRPANVRTCFEARWAAHRFERLGELIMLPAGQPMHTRGDGGEQASISVALRPDALRAWFDDRLDWSEDQLDAGLDINAPIVRALMLRLAGEARAPGFASEMLVELVAGQIAIELARHRATLSDPGTGGLAPWRLRLIDERLREVRSPPSLAELAALCTISVRQLTRGFRASRGISIGDHVAQSRIDGAKRLLRGDECVKAIAFSMGFASPSSFASAFRRATGLTPSDYREALPR